MEVIKGVAPEARSVAVQVFGRRDAETIRALL
jgi:hypothetical protein